MGRLAEQVVKLAATQMMHACFGHSTHYNHRTSQSVEQQS